MNLTPHFSLEELTATAHRELDNTPPAAVVEALTDTAQHMEAVRALLGDASIHVNSGYRSAAVNKAVGGAASSAHLGGHACDFICPAFGSPLSICRMLAASRLQFDQLIEEGTWVHISFDPKMRRQILTKREGGGYALGLPA